MPEPTTLYCGDNRDILPGIGPVDAVVTDPPYGLAFMGKGWDHAVPGVDYWTECFRVMKPGAHLLAFGGTRTHHRMMCAIEDAGFEIRDTLSWLYGSGFPKSLDVGKAIDKAAGAEREVVGNYRATRDLSRNGRTGDEAISPIPVTGATLNITAPATDAARQWDGWGTALKPGWEPIIMARKPLAGTVAANVLTHGTGAINVDACRIGWAGEPPQIGTPGWGGPNKKLTSAPGVDGETVERMPPHTAGRWPANVLLDEDAAAMLDARSGERGGRGGTTVSDKNGYFGLLKPVADDAKTAYRDTGGASRFFTVVQGDGLPITNPDTARFLYQPKASRSERNAGLDGMPEREWRGNYGDGIQDNRPHTREGYEYRANVRNHHPTVKPVALMRWLVRLVTPPGGIVLDPFMGSGSTGVAAVMEGMQFVGIEQEPEYVEIARRRIAHAETERAATIAQLQLVAD